MHITVRRVGWYIKQALTSMGWAGVLALGLLTASAAIDSIVLRQMQSQTRLLQQKTAVLRAQVEAKGSNAHTLHEPTTQLATFYTFFPKHDALADSMASLYKAAAQQNLNLDQGEYKFTKERDSRLSRYDIELPVRGGYVQIRRFIAAAMTEVPSLSLHGVTFNRQKIGDSLIDAQIRFILYLGEE